MVMKRFIFKSSSQRLVDEFRLFTISKIVGLKRALQAWKWLLVAGAIFLLCISPSYGKPNDTTQESSPPVISGSANKKPSINSDNSELGESLPNIASIFPRVIFPNKDGSYSFKVNGSGFSKTGTDNNLIISTKNSDDTFSAIPEIKVCWKGEGYEKCKNSNPDWATGTAQSPRRLDFDNIKVNDQGDLGIQIRVGEKVSDPPYPITLSRVGYWTPAIWALGILLVIILILLGLLRNKSGEQNNPKNNKFKSFFKSIFLDQETNTYSLSRLQFYLWTLVSVFSYAYLFIARSFAQGKLEFIDIPEGLPVIFLVSAATSAFATGISNTKGSKGSGEVDPSVSDFITAGGYIVPERLQFFVWTIVGIIVYIIVVIFQNPGQIQGLPTIPQGFLQLSGVSSLGYLGGKLARKPGPVISSIDKAIYDDNSKQLILVINGSNLSQDATFKIEKGNKDSISSPKDVIVKTTIKDPETGDSSLAKILEIQIPSSQNVWPKIEKPYELTLYNPDGQFAVWRFDGTESPAVGDASAEEQKIESSDWRKP